MGALENKPEHRFFFVTEWADEWEAATKEILQLVKEDKVRYRETIKGFENAPQALRDVLTGKNFGSKLLKSNLFQSLLSYTKQHYHRSKLFL